MPLVFVHGVNVRRGKSPKEKKRFDDSVARRDALFQLIGLAEVVRPPHRLHIGNPYWGDAAAKFSYDLASVPVPDTERFGADDEGMAQVLAATLPYCAALKIAESEEVEPAVLLTLAREASLAHAVDAVIAAAANLGPAASSLDLAWKSDEFASFAARALSYGTSNPSPPWLNATVDGELRLRTDSRFLEKLIQEVDRWPGTPKADTEAFGSPPVLAWLKMAATGVARIGKDTARTVVQTVSGGARRAFRGVTGTMVGAGLGAVGGAAPEILLRAKRPQATQRAGIFLGDIFTYLRERGTREEPGRIIKIITKHLDAALAMAKKSDQDTKLVVVAHSLGGVIVYDILTYYRPDITVDLLVTVGSQVALFKELQLYVEDQAPEQATPRLEVEVTDPTPNTPTRVPKPDTVRAWINIFDPTDVLGFAAEGVFEGVKDLAFYTEASLLNAHGMYFYLTSFHERLREHVRKELGP